MRGDAYGLHAHGLTQDHGRLGEALYLAQKLPQVSPRARIARLEPHRLVERGLRRRIAPEKVEAHAETPVQRGAVGLQLERRAVRPLGFAIAALTTQTQGKVGPCDYVPRAQTDGLAQLGLRLRVAPLAAQR